MRLMKLAIVSAAAVLTISMFLSVVTANKSKGGGGLPGPLDTMEVPTPGDLNDFIKDEGAALRLGKAFFWDEQVGSDGRVVCATCHWHAGADGRDTNQVNPGANGIFELVPGPGATLTAVDFPFPRPNNDDVVGSQGVVAADFVAISGTHIDICNPLVPPLEPPFIRQVTGRNTPIVVNAVFFEDIFHDGRAKEEFNGVTPSGPGDPSNPLIWVNDGPGLVLESVTIKPAGTSSQAVGPPNNDIEMACGGPTPRTFADLGSKLLDPTLTPLGQQFVAPDDSVLGTLSAAPGMGLTTGYKALVVAAFQPRFVSDQIVPGGFTQTEANLSLFWGLAVHVYVRTLVSDDSKFDRFRKGLVALSAKEVLGANVFLNKGNCIKCHGSPLFSNDTFINTGVRPIAEDPGRDPLKEGKGKFKTPTLRNLDMSGPYFHNGGYGTVRQVVEFYDIGGEHVSDETDGLIVPLNLTEAEKEGLTCFLLTLSDDRLRNQEAPFDHPSLIPPVGPMLPAVGAGGCDPMDPLCPLGEFGAFSPCALQPPLTTPCDCAD